MIILFVRFSETDQVILSLKDMEKHNFHVIPLPISVEALVLRCICGGG